MRMTDPRIVMALVKLLVTVAEIVQEVGEIPSGHLYMHLQTTTGMSLAAYEELINALKRCGLVEVKNNVVRYIGPERQVMSLN